MVRLSPMLATRGEVIHVVYPSIKSVNTLKSPPKANNNNKFGDDFCKTQENKTANTDDKVERLEFEATLVSIKLLATHKFIANQIKPNIADHFK